MQKLFSYIIPIDDGPAPNPFGDICTLAICKPAIRRKAQVGDWVIGILNHHLSRWRERWWRKAE